MNDDPRLIRIADYDYLLPDDRIAKHPLAERDRCRLLVRRHDGTLEEHAFTELPELLPSDAMLVYNNTRVINARLRFRKGDDGSGALIEVFCLEPAFPADYAMNFASDSGCSWTCFVGNSKRWKDGVLRRSILVDGTEVTLSATRTGRDGNASEVRFDWDVAGVTFSRIIQAAGEIPIPPYLNRSTEESDSADYQTVYGRIEGSVAAPTAGLHFTPAVLEAVDRRGITRRELTLHVGAGTFQPVKSDTVGEHGMHSEFISVPRSLIEELAFTDRRVIAVGTTSVRTLESLYHAGCLVNTGDWHGEVPQWYPYDGNYPVLSRREAFAALLRHLDESGATRFVASTRIIIAPGYDYRVVEGMVTNFHQPQSTLLLLVSAFTGGDWRRMYDFALDRGFRFLSYGDASLLL
ncbi:S-adenosylmethionine:tRNA ribosyltransferase-isomerase [uncultured Muribaculum sp.]|uniref:S-adenosylmethionine:tRNA ribosyltransferase-isomerase n=1 Tax=uncultured Muribaculum sp. TaxID=1918613 RepID=UPI0025E21601|nr:S-adenosylmethionine:tRNA ribosyltransferase-isomerase [uncultured Muribaculum sp.]